jgi:CubicO group peptidase (beta-lactamase class C family)
MRLSRPEHLAAVAIVAATLVPMSARQAVPQPGRTSETVAATSDAPSTLLRDFVADGKIAGAVAGIFHRGQTTVIAAGVEDLERQTPMQARTLFRIYSMTKSVTAVAVMMLHDEGLFALTDPVAKYLPAFAGVMVVDAPGRAPRPPVRAITVEDLLLHTSGLSHRTSDLYRRLEVRSRADDLPTFIRKITRAPLMEDPHTRFRYSEATTVLGRLVEIWSGQRFDDFLTTRVLRPLGMTDTGFWVDAAHAARLATVYSPSAAGELRPMEIESVPFTTRPALLEGAVGLVSTVPDYLRFCQMLLNRGELDGQRLLRAETVDRITRNGLPDDVRKARGGRMGWGLANVNVVDSPDGSGAAAPMGEYGWDGTAGTIFWVNPATQTAIVLMTQSVPANPDNLRQRFKTVVDRALGR